MKMDDWEAFSEKQSAAAIKALSILSRPGFRFYRRKPSVQGASIGLGAYSRDTELFLKTISEGRLFFPFDWVEWQRRAKPYITSPLRLETASILTLRKLLYVHVRKERFVTGHLEEMIKSGHIKAILERLALAR